MITPRSLYISRSGSRQPDLAQNDVDEAFAPQHQDPGDVAHDHAGQQRGDDEEEQQQAHGAAARAAWKGDRIAEQKATERDGERQIESASDRPSA